jgi:hypothetical protein
MWLGQKPVDDPYITVGQIVTFFYFFLFLVAIPASGLIDSYLAKPYLLYKK